MYASDDTIVAIATPPGRGALGIVRISGPGAHGIALRLLGRERPLPARRAVVGHVRDAGSSTGTRAFDQVIALFFPAPHSYSGEDTVEFSVHGGPAILSGVVRGAMAGGARLAGHGEFTLRAFLNGRLDLVQAEAVGDLVDAVTPRQARMAYDQLRGTLSERIAQVEQGLFDVVARLEASLDFPEEGYHFVEREGLPDELEAIERDVERLLGSAQAGRVIREGRVVALVGRPNVGKSSVFNALVGADRAIVTAVAGTTRDLLSERVEVEGIPVTLVDSAGIQEAADVVEQEGVRRAQRLAADADLRLVVLDRSRALEATDRELIDACDDRTLIVVNKVDEPAAWSEPAAGVDHVRVSALTGEGLGALRRTIAERLTGRQGPYEEVAITNVRHEELLRRAQEALGRARAAVRGGAAEEFVLLDIREALDSLADVTGKRSADDILQAIFSRFCIGK